MTRIFVVGSILWSHSITVGAIDKNNKSVDVGADVNMVGGSGSFLKAIEGQHKITYDGQKDLAFGVQLYEVYADKKTNRLKLKETFDPYKARKPASKSQQWTKLGVEPQIIGNPKEAKFLNLVEDRK